MIFQTQKSRPRCCSSHRSAKCRLTASLALSLALGTLVKASSISISSTIGEETGFARRFGSIGGGGMGGRSMLVRGGAVVSDRYNARMQYMITRNMRKVLVDELDYRPEEVDDMDPQIAAVVIEKSLPRPRAGMPIVWRKSIRRRKPPNPLVTFVGSASDAMLSMCKTTARVVTSPFRASGDLIRQSYGAARAGSGEALRALGTVLVAWAVVVTITGGAAAGGGGALSTFKFPLPLPWRSRRVHGGTSGMEGGGGCPGGSGGGMEGAGGGEEVGGVVAEDLDMSRKGKGVVKGKKATSSVDGAVAGAGSPSKTESPSDMERRSPQLGNKAPKSTTKKASRGTDGSTGTRTIKKKKTSNSKGSPSSGNGNSKRDAAAAARTHSAATPPSPSRSIKPKRSGTSYPNPKATGSPKKVEKEEYEGGTGGTLKDRSRAPSTGQSKTDRSKKGPGGVVGESEGGSRRQPADDLSASSTEAVRKSNGGVQHSKCEENLADGYEGGINHQHNEEDGVAYRQLGRDAALMEMIPTEEELEDLEKFERDQQPQVHSDSWLDRGINNALGGLFGGGSSGNEGES